MPVGATFTITSVRTRENRLDAMLRAEASRSRHGAGRCHASVFGVKLLGHFVGHVAGAA